MIILIQCEDEFSLKEARQEVDVILSQKKADNTVSEGGVVTNKAGDVIATFTVSR